MDLKEIQDAQTSYLNAISTSRDLERQAKNIALENTEKFNAIAADIIKELNELIPFFKEDAVILLSSCNTITAEVNDKTTYLLQLQDGGTWGIKKYYNDNIIYNNAHGWSIGETTYEFFADWNDTKAILQNKILTAYNENTEEIIANAQKEYDMCLARQNKLNKI